VEHNAIGQNNTRKFVGATKIAVACGGDPLYEGAASPSFPDHESHRMQDEDSIRATAPVPESLPRPEPAGGGDRLPRRDGGGEADWDAYWDAPVTCEKRVYDVIAAFYRRFIIRPAVNHFLSKWFVPQAELLHAGCGSGAVDVDMARLFRISALDISKRGLDEYARLHPNVPALIHGSIFNIPVPDESFDGLFNLGVTEHFFEDQIAAILREFNRILRPGGLIVLYWPPAYGLSVIALKVIHFVLNRILRRGIELHPPELTHVRSRAQTQGWLEAAGFELIEYYFGPRDFFTHQIVVGKRVRSLDS